MAVNNVNTEISKLLSGEDPTKQADIDKAMIELDGTPNKARLGANAILGASLAVSKAGAASRGTSLFDHMAHLADRKPEQMRLPTPCLNVINGGEVRAASPVLPLIPQRLFDETRSCAIFAIRCFSPSPFPRHPRGRLTAAEEGGPVDHVLVFFPIL